MEHPGRTDNAFAPGHVPTLRIDNRELRFRHGPRLVDVRVNMRGIEVSVVSGEVTRTPSPRKSPRLVASRRVNDRHVISDAVRGINEPARSGDAGRLESGL